MPENEEHMTSTSASDLSKNITDLVAELEQCRKRALEIELQLSVIDEALRAARGQVRPIGRPRGRPRKDPLADRIITQIYGGPGTPHTSQNFESVEAIEAEDFGGNTAA